VVKLSSAKAHCTLSSKKLKAGTYHVVATYGGSTDFGGSASGHEALVIVK
jgi:hypothetical protein